MKRLTHAQGYTIVEVMIFLIITGVLLVTGTLVFNGRQRRTQFTQGVREIDAQIRTIINETASGHYPNQGDIKCTSNGNGPQLYPPTNENQQGGNEGCLFLGRVLQFTTGDTYAAYTVVGQQRTAAGKEVTSLGQGADDAQQTLITPTDAEPDLADATESFTMPWGITVEKIVSPLPTAPTIGAFGLISSLGSYSTNGTDLVSGTTRINLVPLVGSTLGATIAGTKQSTINNTEDMASDPQNPGKIVLCLRSGGGDRRAAIIIGGNNNNIGTEIMIDNVPGEC